MNSTEWFDRLADLYLTGSRDKRYAEGRQRYCANCQQPILARGQHKNSVCWKCHQEKVRGLRKQAQKTGSCADCGTPVWRQSKRCNACASKERKRRV